METDNVAPEPGSADNAPTTPYPENGEATGPIGEDGPVGTPGIPGEPEPDAPSQPAPVGGERDSECTVPVAANNEPPPAE